ncbi:MAG: oligosaccharide repeat unit polymerase [Bifidobacteriaceae bacterium]|jgi:oligosaccharide repeat unit polymerase|nr:oligosaccharide repeat unit polymerase [Bifidobacteriaceae bacterium]
MAPDILFYSLLIEFAVVFLLSRGNWLAPSVVFVGVFLVAAFDLTLMQDYWAVRLSPKTVFVVLIGTGSFAAAAELVKRAIRVRAGSAPTTHRPPIRRTTIRLTPTWTAILCAVYIFTIWSVLAYVQETASSLGATGGLTELIGYYNDVSKRSLADVLPPTWLRALHSFCITSGYVWAFSVVDSAVHERRIAVGSCALFGLSLMAAFSTGSRGDAISLLISLVVLYVLSVRRKDRRLTRKVYAIAFAALLLVALTFQSAAGLVGRDSGEFGGLEYFSIYLGAPLLNLDQWIAADWPDRLVWGQETFHTLYSGLGRALGADALQYDTVRPFTSANGHATGNVGTAFFDLFHDFGLAGVIAFSALMGCVMAILAARVDRRVGGVDPLTEVVYVFMLFLLARSFFANSWLSAVVSLTFVRMLVSWWVLFKFFGRPRATLNTGPIGVGTGSPVVRIPGVNSAGRASAL